LSEIVWTDVGNDAARLLSRYIQIDTTNPPGNERAAVEFLEGFLTSRSIPSARYTSAPDRANLLAKLEGDGSAAPVMLLHHMDVVPANRDRWAEDPFSGSLADGHVLGRGAIDDKGLGVMQLIAFGLLRDSGVAFKRDILLLAVSDEESGGKLGSQWMVENHWPDIQCEYVWDEGGTGTIGIMGNRPVFAVSVAEKKGMNVRLTTQGTGGHGSFVSTSPLNRMVTALNRLQSSRMPAQFGDVTKKFLREVSRTQSFPSSWLVRNAYKPVVRTLVANKLAAIPAIDAMLRDTVTLTSVQSGAGTNVAPDSAIASLDVRLLPSTDKTDFLRRLKSALGDDSVIIESADPPPIVDSSATDSEFFRALNRVIVQRAPDSIVTPIQTPVGTDSRFFRSKGAHAYGLLPAILTQADLDTIHGANERISVTNLEFGTRIIYETLLELCA
jgi:acetylornithine deacetylase/succinyl-diaminopimelate desuccinylase-like protein